MSEPDGHAAASGAFRQVIENVAAGIAILQDGRIAYVYVRPFDAQALPTASVAAAASR